MRETKRMPTSNFTFQIDSQSSGLKAFDAPSGTTALPHLPSFTRDHCNPWNYHQMHQHSALLHPVSLVFSKPAFLSFRRFGLKDTSVFEAIYIVSSICYQLWNNVGESRKDARLEEMLQWTFNDGFRKCFIRETALFLFSQIATHMKLPLRLFFGSLLTFSRVKWMFLTVFETLLLAL